MQNYDAIVIGSGQAGTPLSKKLAKKGLKTALIEKRFIGGTCVNDGCTPTKAMIASARAAHVAKNSSELGVIANDISIDFKRIVQRKNDIVTMFREGSEKGLEKTENLSIHFGSASFTGVKSIDVKTEAGTIEKLIAEQIFINVGTTPVIPPIPGLDQIPYLTSTTILDLKEIPRHLLIVGGGYVAMEFGQMFKRLGSEITLVEKGKRLFSKEDKDVADCLAGILRKEGLIMHSNTTVSNFKKASHGIEATLISDSSETSVTCSHVLISAGRRPNVEELCLDKTGVLVDGKGYIQVDSYLQTAQAGIYALGDVTGGPAFTHIAYNDHLIVYKNLFEGSKISTDNRMVPYCMFTDPQLARVGITEEQAKKDGIAVRVASLSMSNVARAIETGETGGLMKAIIDEKTSRILGAAIIGEQAGEVLSVLQVAMMGDLTWHQLREGIFSHPTYSESINNLFMTLE